MTLKLFKLTEKLNKKENFMNQLNEELELGMKNLANV